MSVELCGGCHVRNTAEIGLLRIVSEGGVAAGVRRIEAVAGPMAFQLFVDRDRALTSIASRLKVQIGGTANSLDQLERKVDALLDERKQLEKRLDEAMRGVGDGDGLAQRLAAQATSVHGVALVVSVVTVADARALQVLGDALRETMRSGVGVLGAELGDGKGALLVVASDDARARGLTADVLVREIALTVGGRGGGKPHMAQAGVELSKLTTALDAATGVVERLVGLSA